ncbi:MAG: hypothetical protein ACI9VM_000254 [Candidatus Azotimanducaceae bacterium]|jgi:hypothetical protein
MPLATIWRDSRLVDDKKAVSIRDVVQFAVQETLKVNLDEVEVRVRDIGSLDINYMPIGIEIDTGTGKGRWRVKQRQEIATEIADRVFRTGVMDNDWVGADKSYVWIRICESSFVPIGHPESSR